MSKPCLDKPRSVGPFSLKPIQPNKTNSRYMYHNINKLYNMHQTNPKLSIIILSYRICIIFSVPQRIWVNKKKQTPPDYRNGLDLTFPSDLVHSFWRLFANVGKLPNLTGLNSCDLRKGHRNLIAVIQKSQEFNFESPGRIVPLINFNIVELSESVGTSANGSSCCLIVQSSCTCGLPFTQGEPSPVRS